MRFITALCLGAVIAGGACDQKSAEPVPGDQVVAADPVAVINRQIDQFNSTCNSDMGVFPIDRRIVQIIYDAKTDSVNCIDREGDIFIRLMRQHDRNFKGTIEVQYHQLADPTEKHSWGQVIVEFNLPGSIFDQR